MPIIADSWISSTTAAGLPKIGRRKVQIDPIAVTADGGGVGLSASASTALAPLLHRVLYDTPRAYTQYTRGDVVTVLRNAGQPVPPVANPYSILRVQGPAAPLPATEVWLCRIDVLTQTAQWAQAITAWTPGAVPDTDWDPVREQTLTEDGPSYGMGHTLTVHGVLYHGYLPAIPITVGVQDYATATEVDPEGIVSYEHPALIAAPGLVLHKFDLVVLADGRRLIVEDHFQPVQRFAVPLGTVYFTEYRQPGDVSYRIPLTGG